MGTRPGMKITPGVEAKGMAAPVDWVGSAGAPSATAGSGGAVFPAAANAAWLAMGGGGGAGDINNNDPVLSSGGEAVGSL